MAAITGHDLHVAGVYFVLNVVGWVRWVVHGNDYNDRIATNPNIERKVTTLDSLELARTIAELLEDKKAENILVLDLRPDRVIADFFVIATGTSDRNLRALAEHVRVELKDKHNTQAASAEGVAESGWVLLDYGVVIVHIFLEERRQYYDLEGLWRPDSKVVLSIN